MQTEHLQSFIALAEELHFGRAAQKLGLLPASLGRHIRLLEDSLTVPLFTRTTRTVALTEQGNLLLAEARPLMEKLNALAVRFQTEGRRLAPQLRMGAIDSAAAAVLPRLLALLHSVAPHAHLRLSEDKSARLLPKLLSGQLDLALMRPPARLPKGLMAQDLGYETAMLALAEDHPLAAREQVALAELQELALIVPDRRARPHSYDLTFRLLEQIGALPRVAQIADEKHTILGLVAAGIGAAIVPRTSLTIAPRGVTARPLTGVSEANRRLLPLALIWPRAVRDPLRDLLIAQLSAQSTALAEWI